MSDILTIRVPSEEKTHWERAAAAVQETVADYVRKAVRQRVAGVEGADWDKLLGSVDTAAPPPTNANVRKAFSGRQTRRG